MSASKFCISRDADNKYSCHLNDRLIADCSRDPRQWFDWDIQDPEMLKMCDNDRYAISKWLADSLHFSMGLLDL